MFKSGDIVSIYLQLSLDKPYMYKVPSSFSVEIGDIVSVNFNNRIVFGIVYQKEENVDFDVNKIKEIINVIEDIPALGVELINFIKWLSTYNVVSFSRVLKLIINVSGLNLLNYTKYLSLNSAVWTNLRKTKSREQVAKEFLFDELIEKEDLIKRSQVSNSVVNEMIKQKALNVTSEVKVSNFQSNIKYTPVSFLEEQEKTIADIKQYLSENCFNVTVLKGVPGSGKTEVYFDLVQEVLNQNKQVLILLPEIGLTSQIVERFKLRFNVDPYVWHSDISKATKKDTWLAAHNGNLKVIIGARSALFISFINLGLIIVDEEHDSSYKQEEGVFYNARDMAIVRAKMHNIPIILASATPSLETSYNVQRGKYKQYSLASRANQLDLPEIKVIDMLATRKEKNKSISIDLLEKMQQTLKRQEQVLLFVNKRGYSSVFCTSCNEPVSCKFCSVSLVYHKVKDVFMCHYCGYTIKYTDNCINAHCKNPEGSLVTTIGAGVEKVYEEVSEAFPDNKVAVLSSDTLKSYKDVITMVDDINDNKYDILIGTQIISKGYNFPNLTLVGIINAAMDDALDLKSSERTWQMLYQVAGRSGRAEKKGTVYVQTYTPNTKLIRFLVDHDYEGLINHEIQNNKQVGIPPFGKYAALIISSENEDYLQQLCDYMESVKPEGGGVEVYGPSKALIYFLRNRYRYRFLIHTDLSVNIQKVVKLWLSKVNSNIKARIQIDIDPVSFY